MALFIIILTVAIYSIISIIIALWLKRVGLNPVTLFTSLGLITINQFGTMYYLYKYNAHPKLIGIIMSIYVIYIVFFPHLLKTYPMKKKRRKSKKTTTTSNEDIVINLNEYAENSKKAFDKTIKQVNDIKERTLKMNAKGLATPILVVLLLIVFIVICNPIAIVGVGERGVKVTLGKVSPQSYTEGIHLITPFISKIKNMDVKTQKRNIATDLYTKDIQQATISYVINYNLQPQNAHKMYREVGTGYVDNILMPVVEGTIKDVIGRWNAQDLVANREVATSDILVKLQKQLEPRYINVTGFQITDINYSAVFEKAIENKVTAEQEALKAKNRTVQIEEEAKQKIISAEAEAKSMAIRANALAKNKALVEYEAVQKWNGKLPEYMMGNTVPFLNIATKR